MKGAALALPNKKSARSSKRPDDAFAKQFLHCLLAFFVTTEAAGSVPVASLLWAAPKPVGRSFRIALKGEVHDVSGQVLCKAGEVVFDEREHVASGKCALTKLNGVVERCASRRRQTRHCGEANVLSK